jgi:hypothetical protein
MVDAGEAHYLNGIKEMDTYHINNSSLRFQLSPEESLFRKIFAMTGKYFIGTNGNKILKNLKISKEALSESPEADRQIKINNLEQLEDDHGNPKYAQQYVDNLERSSR